MFLIVGLGNPEERYSKTRHNMGFDVVNKLAEKYEISISKHDFDGIYGTGKIEDEKVILLKPQTFMNLSGKSILSCMRFFKIELKDVIVIYDDFDLNEGTIRIRKNGGTGTHNGIRSVVEYLSTEEFARVRIGIGGYSEKTNDSIKDYVIEKLSEEEYKVLETGINSGLNAIIEILRNGIESAMNIFN